MSFLKILAEARATLDLTPEDGPAAVKRAYRRKVQEHPPDTDPEGFRRVRAAYELLASPPKTVARAREILLARTPSIEPPAAPVLPETPPVNLPLVLLRLAATQVSVTDLTPSAPRRSSQ